MLRMSQNLKLANRLRQPCLQSFKRTQKTNPNPDRVLLAGPGGQVAKVVAVVGGVGGLIGGLVGGYAWYDPTFRSRLEQTVPYSKDVIEFVTRFVSGGEEVLSRGDAAALLNNTLDVSPITAAGMSDAGGEPQNPDQTLGSRWESPAPTTAPLSKEEKRAEEKRKKAEEKLANEEAKKRETEMLKKKMIEKENEEAYENEELQKRLRASMSEAEVLVKSALDQQKSVVEATREHAAKLKQALDDSTDIMMKDDQWQLAIDSFKDKQGKDATAEQTFAQAMEHLDALKVAVDKGRANKVTSRNAALLPAQDMVAKSKKALVTAANETSKARGDVRMTINSHEMTEKARKQMKEEVEMITPEVMLGGKRGKKFTEEELNLLLVHAYRRNDQLQKQLANQIAFEMQRTQKALDEQQTMNEITNAEHAKQLLMSREAEFEVEREKMLLDARVEHERQAVKELARQAAAHSEHLKDILAAQQVELDKKAETRLNAALLEARQSFQAEIALSVARLKGIEAAIDGRAEQEKVARDAQTLWLACVALSGAIARGDEDGRTWEAQLKPLSDQILAIKQAAGQHLFVETVINSLPEKAYTRGAWKEDNLVKRFSKVKRTCRRVALVGEEEHTRTLFRFLVSYIQSFFVFAVAHAKNENDEIEINELDTFACLANAEYWLRQGNLEHALRFMMQLKGEAREVASDWISETRLLLELKQAARLLTAFASATGLGTVF